MIAHVPPWVMETFCRVCRLTPKVASFLAASHKEQKTIPFLARYRKEQTHSMTEKDLERVLSAFEELSEVDVRRAKMLSAMEKDGVEVSEALSRGFMEATTLAALEELYEPFRPDKSSLAQKARDAGLTTVADAILKTTDTVKFNFKDPESSKLLRALLCDTLFRTPNARNEVVTLADKGSYISASLDASRKLSAAKKLPDGKFAKMLDAAKYYDKFRRSVTQLRPHNTLALLRAASNGVMKLTVTPPVSAKDTFKQMIKNEFPGFHRKNSIESELVHDCLAETYSKHVLPSVVNHIKRRLKNEATEAAIEVFANNLRSLLLQRPLARSKIMAIDPGYHKGCKTVVLSEDGSVLGTGVLMLKAREQSMQQINNLCKEHGVSKIVIGNGTASRETEQLVADAIKRFHLPAQFSITSEVGASVYSASKLARQELPDLDILFRGAVSIGRRVQDPLSELVKVPPHSIGVGMYQHDIPEVKLAKRLKSVVQSCVASVGINVNTASPHVLRQVPGLTQPLADKIVAHRQQNKEFKSRMELLRVPGMTSNAFQQAAGFLRVPGGNNPLDDTIIHPETYSLTLKVLEHLKLTLKERTEAAQRIKHFAGDVAGLAEALDGVGKETVQLIVKELSSPSVDPRQQLPYAGLFRQDLRNMSDLKEGAELRGFVTTITDFGAFVDVGLPREGFITSRMMNSYNWQMRASGRSPLSLGEVLTLRVTGVMQETHSKNIRFNLIPLPTTAVEGTALKEQSASISEIAPVELGNTSSAASQSVSSTSRSQRKRQKKRSRSPTPPPGKQEPEKKAAVHVNTTEDSSPAKKRARIEQSDILRGEEVAL